MGYIFRILRYFGLN